ncbi:cobalamin biosynthesis protein [Pseudomonas gessardii]|uniref:Cobalamin biosynthesis protein CobE n=1 Tax=Pseudomonas gessardii TaxID=78544 RepID=A0ABS9F7F0_9PSED|nr:cobalamin biosynthesis protein [Pseudomonas gessardii]MBH3421229.1 cobalamin biosynthesis protein [Pseudomonas gessardii]MCF4981203.1 cobalamin biosynthesis protein CobE [Pseudomonas gessardii]MCF4991547.1 cobalamin biosynthesis protein CobE [Pseudomonas gessardii]MCF5084883.1 cobalamin biosynthesis protein CobE [Pseudomonas gessardii]MCF5096176.1 cobalamin biosynthesis protein CobE [Pseudomonas gessardii]
MILTVGLGCQRGCQVEALLELFGSALAEAGIDPGQVSALASIAHKRDEPGMIALAKALNLPLQCFDAQQLLDYEGRLSHRSNVAFAHTGCYGIAESAALALAEQLANAPARLLITRKKAARATFALACAG